MGQQWSLRKSVTFFEGKWDPCKDLWFCWCSPAGWQFWHCMIKQNGEILFMLNYLWAIKLESLGTNKKSLKKNFYICIFFASPTYFWWEQFIFSPFIMELMWRVDWTNNYEKRWLNKNYGLHMLLTKIGLYNNIIHLLCGTLESQWDGVGSD